MTSVSKIQRQVYLSIVTTVLAAGLLNVILFSIRQTVRQPVDLHEYGLDPVILHYRLAVYFFAILGAVFFSYSRIWPSLAVSMVPLILLTRWLYVFHNRWLDAVAQNPTFGSDDGLPPGDFLAFFIVRGGLIAWDIIALLMILSLAVWQLAILKDLKPVEK